MKASSEVIQFSEDAILLSRQVDLPAFDHPLHRHPEIELTWIEKSAGERMIGEDLGRFEEGDFYLLGPQLPHLFSQQTPPPGGARAEVLQLHAQIMNQPIMCSPALRDVQRLIRRSAGGLCYRGEAARRLGSCVKKIRTADGPSQWRLFFQLWEEMLSLPEPEPISGTGDGLPGAPAHCERIERVCHYMIGHFQEDISHRDMAAMAHYSPAAFSRSFKRITRKTFTQFLTEIRLRHACTLLRETDWPILRIAMESGFQNLSNFNRRFIATRGETPGRYRKRQSQFIPAHLRGARISSRVKATGRQ